MATAGTASLIFVSAAITCAAADPADLERVRAECMPPTTVRAPAAIDRDGLDGRVLCGYQGWFATEGDGSGLGWNHWRMRDRTTQSGWRPAVDMLPDVSELGEHERFTIHFGEAAHGAIEVFSSHIPSTVNRHFRWMRDHAIDGVFVQRFGVTLGHPARLAQCTKVLRHCRDGALEHGRVYAVMYDLSGMQAGSLREVLEDWRRLRERMEIGSDAASLHVGGKPLVALWGIGFNDDRDYTLAECRDLIRGLKDDGCAVLCGVPTGWRTLDRDAVRDPVLHEVMAECDVISPWTVGRYKTPEEVQGHAIRHWRPDIEWCRARGIGYLPVAFPGFSWHNLKGGPLGQIPRLGGRFLWSQAVAAHEAGATSLYVAMFDEVDEATAIFKCVDPPPGDLSARFVGMEGLPSDHYLRLTGEAGRLLRGERSTSFASPAEAAHGLIERGDRGHRVGPRCAAGEAVGTPGRADSRPP